ncbi:putative arabinogalactan protein/22/41 [Helianthus anomalus]
MLQHYTPAAVNGSLTLIGKGILISRVEDTHGVGTTADLALNSLIFTPLNPNRNSTHYSHTLHDQNPDLAPSIFLKFDQKTMNSRSVAVAFIGFVFMALFGVNRAQEFAPVPAPVPGNDGAAIDQGVVIMNGLVVCMCMIGGWGVELTVVIVEDEGGWWVFLERDGGGRRWQWWLWW